MYYPFPVRRVRCWRVWLGPVTHSHRSSNQLTTRILLFYFFKFVCWLGDFHPKISRNICLFFWTKKNVLNSKRTQFDWLVAGQGEQWECLFWQWKIIYLRESISLFLSPVERTPHIFSFFDSGRKSTQKYKEKKQYQQSNRLSLSRIKYNIRTGMLGI
jgi:hypothetical protein